MGESPSAQEPGLAQAAAAWAPAVDPAAIERDRSGLEEAFL